MRMPESGESVEINRILGALPEEEFERLLPHLEVVALEHGASLIEPYVPTPYVYFPIDCVISMISVLDDGQSVEVGTVGNEGVLGLPLFLGQETTPLGSVCQVPGRAAKMEADTFRGEAATDTRLHEHLQRYTEAMFVFAAQSSACNRMHSIEQRAARWLLHTHDRVSGDEFALTQQFFAQMLGVRRASISEVASSFQDQGLIRYSRGNIQILDRGTLKDKACECYRVIKEEFDRLPSGAEKS